MMGLVFSLFFSSASECEVFSLKIFALKWIFVLACCFRQTSKRHLLLWLTDGGDALDDESPSIKKTETVSIFPFYQFHIHQNP